MDGKRQEMHHLMLGPSVIEDIQNEHCHGSDPIEYVGPEDAATSPPH
jgi:hypothetical protein